MVEGTLVGLATAALATGAVQRGEVCERKPRLELLRDGNLVDIALVDLAVVDSADTAAKAVWEPDSIRELFLTHAKPGTIGLSAIGGCLPAVADAQNPGMHVRLGEGDLHVTAPIAPGLLATLSVEAWEPLDVGRAVHLTHLPSMIALDGERECPVQAGEDIAVRMSRNGPTVLDIDKALALATRRGFSCRVDRSAAAVG
jgi:hypothetical protein